MALIKCPECGREVSDKASTCIHCGYPLSELSQQKPQVSQPAHSPDITSSYSFKLLLADKDLVELECCKCGKVLCLYEDSFYFTSDERCVSNCDIRCSKCGNSAPAYSTFWNRAGSSSQKNKEEKLQCPRCKSTLVTTGSRGVSFWTGLWGSNKTVNRCGKCGFTWEPKR